MVDRAGIARRTALSLATLAGDGRQVVALPPAGREQVLLEMRRMLESVSDVLRGLAGHDLTAIETTAARASGMAMAGDVRPELMRQLPPLFRELGIQTHRPRDLPVPGRPVTLQMPCGRVRPGAGVGALEPGLRAREAFDSAPRLTPPAAG